MSTKRLFEKYREAAIQHHVRLIECDVRASNRAADRLFGFWKEIAAGGPEMLEQLKVFLQDEDPSVRGWAAAQLLDDMPDEAKPVLERLILDAPLEIKWSAEWRLAEWRDKLAHGGESSYTKMQRLLEGYRQAVFRHEAALESGDANDATAAYAELIERAHELRHGGEERPRLGFLTLGADKHPAVRFWSAMHTLDYGPMAEHTLQKLVKRIKGRIGMAASLALTEWKAGRLTFP